MSAMLFGAEETFLMREDYFKLAQLSEESELFQNSTFENDRNIKLYEARVINKYFAGDLFGCLMTRKINTNSNMYNSLVNLCLSVPSIELSQAISELNKHKQVIYEDNKSQNTKNNENKVPLISKMTKIKRHSYITETTLLEYTHIIYPELNYNSHNYEEYRALFTTLSFRALQGISSDLYNLSNTSNTSNSHIISHIYQYTGYTLSCLTKIHQEIYLMYLIRKYLQKCEYLYNTTPFKNYAIGATLTKLLLCYDMSISTLSVTIQYNRIYTLISLLSMTSAVREFLTDIFGCIASPAMNTLLDTYHNSIDSSINSSGDNDKSVYDTLTSKLIAFINLPLTTDNTNTDIHTNIHSIVQQYVNYQEDKWLNFALFSSYDESSHYHTLIPFNPVYISDSSCNDIGSSNSDSISGGLRVYELSSEANRSLIYALFLKNTSKLLFRDLQLSLFSLQVTSKDSYICLTKGEHITVRESISMSDVPSYWFRSLGEVFRWFESKGCMKREEYVRYIHVCYEWIQHRLRCILSSSTSTTTSNTSYGAIQARSNTDSPGATTCSFEMLPEYRALCCDPTMSLDLPMQKGRLAEVQQQVKRIDTKYLQCQAMILDYFTQLAQPIQRKLPSSRSDRHSKLANNTAPAPVPVTKIADTVAPPAKVSKSTSTGTSSDTIALATPLDDITTLPSDQRLKLVSILGQEQVVPKALFDKAREKVLSKYRDAIREVDLKHLALRWRQSRAHGIDAARQALAALYAEERSRWSIEHVAYVEHQANLAMGYKPPTSSPIATQDVLNVVKMVKKASKENLSSSFPALATDSAAAAVEDAAVSTAPLPSTSVSGLPSSDAVTVDIQLGAAVTADAAGADHTTISIQTHDLHSTVLTAPALLDQDDVSVQMASLEHVDGGELNTAGVHDGTESTQALATLSTDESPLAVLTTGNDHNSDPNVGIITATHAPTYNDPDIDPTNPFTQATFLCLEHASNTEAYYTQETKRIKSIASLSHHILHISQEECLSDLTIEQLKGHNSDPYTYTNHNTRSPSNHTGLSLFEPYSVTIHNSLISLLTMQCKLVEKSILMSILIGNHNNNSLSGNTTANSAINNSSSASSRGDREGGVGLLGHLNTVYNTFLLSHNSVFLKAWVSGLIDMHFTDHPVYGPLLSQAKPSFTSFASAKSNRQVKVSQLKSSNLFLPDIPPPTTLATPTGEGSDIIDESISIADKVEESKLVQQLSERLQLCTRATLTTTNYTSIPHSIHDCIHITLTPNAAVTHMSDRYDLQGYTTELFTRDLWANLRVSYIIPSPYSYFLSNSLCEHVISAVTSRLCTLLQLQAVAASVWMKQREHRVHSRRHTTAKVAASTTFASIELERLMSFSSLYTQEVVEALLRYISDRIRLSQATLASYLPRAMMSDNVSMYQLRSYISEHFGSMYMSLFLPSPSLERYIGEEGKQLKSTDDSFEAYSERIKYRIWLSTSLYTAVDGLITSAQTVLTCQCNLIAVTTNNTNSIEPAGHTYTDTQIESENDRPSFEWWSQQLANSTKVLLGHIDDLCALLEGSRYDDTGGQEEREMLLSYMIKVKNTNNNDFYVI